MIKQASLRRVVTDQPEKNGRVSFSALPKRPGSSGTVFSNYATVEHNVDESESDEEEQEISELNQSKNGDDFAQKYGKSNNIMVVVRERPLNRKEKAIRSRNIIRIIEEKVVVLLNPGIAADDYLRFERNKKRKEKTYAFDAAFDSRASNEKVYTATICLLLDGVLNGLNATIFAYGATGAGKTYTMTGTHRDRGLMVLTLQDLFRK